jgi:uncharacterized protein (DUF2384 family)
MNKHAHKLGDFSVFEKMAKDGVSTSFAARTLKSVDPKGTLITLSTSQKTRSTAKELNAEVIGLNKASKDARVTRVVYLLDLATRAFGDEKLAKKFLEKKHPALGETPLAKTDTEWGVRAVEKILNSMIYGLPA